MLTRVTVPLKAHRTVVSSVAEAILEMTKQMQCRRREEISTKYSSSHWLIPSTVQINYFQFLTIFFSTANYMATDPLKLDDVCECLYNNEFD